MCIHKPGKEQTSSRTKREVNKYGKHHIPGQKNKNLVERKDKGSEGVHPTTGY